MSKIESYKLPEENAGMVAESVAARMPSDIDITSLRHDLTDAIYATNDQHLLYSCLVFLNNQVRDENQKDLDSFVDAMPKDILQMAAEYALKESRAGRGIPHSQVMNIIKEKRGWK